MQDSKGRKSTIYRKYDSKPSSSSYGVARRRKSTLKPMEQKPSSATRAGKLRDRKPVQKSKPPKKSFKNMTPKEFVKRYKKVFIPVAAAIVLILVLSVGDVVVSFGKIHPGVQVQGVDVGGMTVDAAATKLETDLTPTLQKAHITIYASEKAAKADDVTISTSSDASLAYADTSSSSSKKKWSATTDTIGAYVDGKALAESAYKIGRSNDPVFGRIAAWFGLEKLSASIAYDEGSFGDFVDTINDAIGTKVKESKIVISDGVASPVEGHAGWLLDESAFAHDIATAMFDTKAPYFIVPMVTVSMHISKATAQKVANQVTSAIAQPVTVTYDKSTWTLNASELADLVSQKVLEPNQVLSIGSGAEKVVSSGTTTATYDTSAGKDPSSSWTLQAFVDQSDVDDYLKDLLGSKAIVGAKDASFDTSSGSVKIIDSQNGKGPDRDAAALELQNILFGSSTDRTVALTDKTIEPDLTTAQAKTLGIKEKLASWSIPLSGTTNRIHNITLLCSMINNSIIKSGDTWSFNDSTGERTAAKGFATAPAIVNGKHEDQLGGGICQVATCVFNAVCFSGLEIVTRTNHDFYIPAYDDSGFCDATVSWTTPDLEWKNDMSTAVLLTASVSSGDVVVSVWGTKDGRTVSCDRGDWKAGAKYTTIKVNDSTLAEGTTAVQQSGQDGRSIAIKYLVKDKNGNIIHNVTFNSKYQAENEIIRVGTKKVSASKTKKSSTGS